MRIAVLGCGRWGSFLAWYLCRTGHEVTLYGRAASWRMERLLKSRENDLLQIPEGVQLTTDLAAAVSRAEALVISVGVQSLRSFLRELAGLDLSGRALVLCMKGLEAETGLRITEIVAQELGPIPCAIWVGPGHVQDFLRGVPNCMVIDSADAALREALIWGVDGVFETAAASGGNLALAIGAGVVTCYLPYLLYTHGLTGMETGRASIMASVEPVVATIVGAAVFHERMGLLSYCGVVLVLSAVVLLNAGPKRRV